MPGKSASRRCAITSSSGTSVAGGGIVRRGERDEAREDLGGYLHAREHRLVGDRIAHQHRQAEREVGDVRKRPPRRDRKRGEGGEDDLLEVARQLLALLPIELVEADDPDAVLDQCRAQLPLEAVAQPVAALAHALADSRDRLRGSETVLRGVLHARLDLILQARDAHHVVLVEVRRVDRAELDALQQRDLGVLRELQHALVEVEPRDLAVEVEPGGPQVVVALLRALLRRLLVIIAHCRFATLHPCAIARVKNERWPVSSGYYGTRTPSRTEPVPTRSGV